ncbi:MAG: hypothetical protein Q8K18_19705 [Burkholderiales bacterium]|nr:hypothetical protein [Burkholderiales bacterium]
MIGLIILIVGVLYLFLLVAVTRAAYRWAKGKGLSKSKCRLAAAGGFLVVYLPVFWDHIPTLIAYKYYCEREAGFWIYKTLEQWKKENPGAEDKLTWTDLGIRSVDSNTGIQLIQLNERFVERLTKHHTGILPVTKSEYAVVDEMKSDVVARQVIVGAGYGNMMVGNDWRSMKFWLGLEPCFGTGIQGMHAYNPIRESFKRMGMKK